MTRKHIIEKLQSFGAASIALLLMISSFIWIMDFPKIDDIPYHKTIENTVGVCADFIDTGSDLDIVGEDFLRIKAGEGLKLFSLALSLTAGDSFSVSFDANNLGEPSFLVIDLYTPDFDDNYNQFTCTLLPGDNHIEGELPYYRGDHPDSCELRIFTFHDSEVEIRNLQINRQVEKRDENETVWIATGLAVIVFAISAAYLTAYIFCAIKRRASVGKENRRRLKRARSANFGIYIIAIVVVTMGLYVLYHNADISYPLTYANGDEMGVYYLVKTIKEFGMSLVNPMIGGITGGDMYDYPYSDKLSFVLVKLVSYFTSNVYLVTNLFYFLNYYLIAITSVFVCLKLNLSKPVSLIVACLYAFSPYIQLRYSHMWLIPYFMIPLVCLIAINIIDGRIMEPSKQLKRNRKFWGFIIISYFCAFTGMYYAYFSCAIFAAAMVIRLMNVEKKDFHKEIYPIAFILSTIFGVITNVIPNFIYWGINGTNPVNELNLRGSSDAEVYALKLTQLLLPRVGHRVPTLNAISGTYNSTYPLVNENSTASLGVVAGIGFVLSILFLFGKSTKYKSISCLNTAAFMIATIGGIGGVISVFISLPVRCYNRMSVIIMFFSLLLVGELLDRLRTRMKTPVFLTACGAIVLLGFYDQTADYVSGDFSGFESTRNLIHQIENTLEPDGLVFELPYYNWPSAGNYKQHLGFLESDSIRWSYGAMQGREEATWQAMVAEKDTCGMLQTLREEGYDGIYLDMVLYSNTYGAEQANQRLDEIIAALGRDPIVSKDGTIYFWDIRT